MTTAPTNHSIEQAVDWASNPNQQDLTDTPKTTENSPNAGRLWHTLEKAVVLGTLILGGAIAISSRSQASNISNNLVLPNNQLLQNHSVHSQEICPLSYLNDTNPSKEIDRFTDINPSRFFEDMEPSQQSTVSKCAELLRNTFSSFILRTPVESAIANGDCSFVKYWTTSQNFQLDDNELIRVIHLSLKAYNVEIIRYLVAFSSDKLTVELKRNLLNSLVENHDLPAIRLLIENNFTDDPSAYSSAIQLAATKGKISIFKYLMRYASNNDIEKSFQLSLLNNHFKIAKEIMKKHDVSSFSTHEKTVQFISEHGLSQGLTFLHSTGYLSGDLGLQAYSWAFFANQPTILEFLKENFDLSNSKPTVNDSPLHSPEEKSSAFSITDSQYLSQAIYHSHCDWEISTSTLDLPTKTKAIIDRLKNSFLTQEFYTYLQTNLNDFSEPQRFKILENLIAYHHNTDSFENLLKGQIATLSSDHQFRLIRLFLFKNPKKSEMLKFTDFEGLNINDKQIAELDAVQKQVSANEREDRSISQKILDAEQSRSKEIPNQEEWKSLVEKTIKPHLQRISTLLDCSLHHIQLENAKYYTSDSVIVELQEIPGLIFKIFPRSSRNNVLERHKQTYKAIDLCQKEGLNRLKIPRATVLEIDGITFLVEEKLAVTGHSFPDFRKRLELMNKNADLKKIADESLKQLAFFIQKTSLCDLKPNNVPLLEDGTGFGLIDLNMHGNTAQCIYGSPDDSFESLIIYIPEENFQPIREGLILAAPGHFRDVDFVSLEQFSRNHSKKILKGTQTNLKQGTVHPDDPIILEESALEGLSPIEKEFTKLIIKKFNDKLQKRDVSIRTDYPRSVLFSIFDILWTDDDLNKLSEIFSITRDIRYNTLVPMYYKIIDHLLQVGVIFEKQEFGGHGDVFRV